MNENPHLSTDQKMVGDIYTSAELMENITVLTDDFGSRFGGTEGERQAVDFMLQKLQAYGLSNVHTEEIDYIGWTRGETTLDIISPIQQRIDCISLPHSPGGTFEGELIDLGDGAPADFERHAADIPGKIVMATSVTYPEGSRRWIHRGEKHGRSLMAGAAGFIFINHYPTYGPATGGVGHDGESLIPGISVGYEDGAYLSRLVKRHGHVKVRITSTDSCKPMVSWNVLADLPGEQGEKEIVMLGCHYDGHDISQGAQDPISGAVAVLEAARVLAKYAVELPHTIRFALWGVEEIGLLGSRDYTKKHAAELDNMRFYLNMDGAGSIETKGISLNEWPKLQNLFEAWQKEMALDFKMQQSVNAHSDHYPFMQAGVPTGGIESVPKRTGGRGYGHTRYDTLDKINERSLREAAALAARLALRLAATPSADWPASRRSAEEVAAVLDSEENREQVAFAEALDAFYQEKRNNAR